MVTGYLEKNRCFCLPHDIAIILAQLTYYKDKLSQDVPKLYIITERFIPYTRF